MKEQIMVVDLGKRQFGEVKRADYKDGKVINVAVNVKENAIIKEIKIMYNFHHEHVLGMFGWSLNTDNSPIIVMPFMISHRIITIRC